MSNAPRSHSIISVLILLWMAVGVMAFTMDLLMSEEAIAQLTDAQRELYDRRPMWLLAVYCVATLSGLVGAIGLLLKKAWSVPVLGVSLAAVLVQFATILFVLDAITLLGAAAAIPFPLTICVLGAASLWYATRAKTHGWLS